MLVSECIAIHRTIEQNQSNQNQNWIESSKSDRMEKKDKLASEEHETLEVTESAQQNEKSHADSSAVLKIIRGVKEWTVEIVIDQQRIDVGERGKR